MVLRFIDLFAGIGGIRKGLELAAIEAGYTPICVFTSEIKTHALKVLKQNYPNEEIVGILLKWMQPLFPILMYYVLVFLVKPLVLLGIDWGLLTLEVIFSLI
mgnify:CR=1 FL=1|jgi:site-specific DNA-cytosine methylase